MQERTLNLRIERRSACAWPSGELLGGGVAFQLLAAFCAVACHGCAVFPVSVDSAGPDGSSRFDATRDMARRDGGLGMDGRVHDAIDGRLFFDAGLDGKAADGASVDAVATPKDALASADLTTVIVDGRFGGDVADGAVSCEPMSLNGQCFSGHFFMECDSQVAPRLLCRPGPPALKDCMWFEGACPPADFDVDCTTAARPDCVVPDGCRAALGFLQGSGRAPWDRARAMTLSVSAAQDEGPADLTLSCSSCLGDDCALALGLCNSMGAGTLAGGEFAGQDDGPQPSMFSVFMEGFGTEILLIEFDPTAAPETGARACLLPYDDSIDCDILEPICANSGELMLAPLPAVGIPLGNEHGSFRAHFVAVPWRGNVVETVDIVGTF